MEMGKGGGRESKSGWRDGGRWGKEREREGKGQRQRDRDRQRDSCKCSSTTTKEIS